MLLFYFLHQVHTAAEDGGKKIVLCHLEEPTLAPGAERTAL
jgi:hypothetical protein